MFQAPLGNGTEQKPVTVTCNPQLADFGRRVNFNVSMGGFALTGITCPRTLFANPKGNTASFETELNAHWSNIEGAVAEFLKQHQERIEHLYEFTIYLSQDNQIEIKAR